MGECYHCAKPSDLANPCVKMKTRALEPLFHNRPWNCHLEIFTCHREEEIQLMFT